MYEAGLTGKRINESTKEKESERKSTRIYEIARECTCVLLEPSFKMTPGDRMGRLHDMPEVSH